MSTRVLVVSAADLMAKGWVAVAPGRTAQGAETNALYAATRALRAVLKFKDPTLAVAVLDALPDGSPPELHAQYDRLPGVLAAHGIRSVYARDGHHVVASYVQAALDAGHDVVVLGSDKRYGQLVSDRMWWFDAYKRVRYTDDSIYQRFLVLPHQLADSLALAGDRDAVVGIKGIGLKGAAELIGEYGSVAGALDRMDALSGRAGNALRRAGREAVEAQLAVATLDRDRPVPTPLDALGWEAPSAEVLAQVYADLGFHGLASGAPPPTPDWVPADDASLAAVLASTAPIALHPVIDPPSPPRGRLVGLALAPEAGAAVYLPLADQLPPALAAWLENPARPKIGHDTKATTVAFARRGTTVRGFVGDAAIASHLREPSGLAPHDLLPVARVVLKRKLAGDVSVLGKGASQRAWSDCADAEVGPVACARAKAAGDLWRKLGPTVDRALHDEAMALSDTLVRMELAGVAVDAAVLRRAGDDWAADRATLEDELERLIGRRINPGSTKQVRHLLYEELGLPTIHRTKTGWSTANATLERLAPKHPVVPIILRWRAIKRLTDMWVTALIATIDADGRVRSTFHPARSFTGRLVNARPDLGRTPGATEDMARIRRAFRAPPGKVLLSVDYHQLGLYVLAHLTGDPALVEPLLRGADMHRETASALFDVPPEDVTVAQRQTGKVVNFATFAGQGANALGQLLGVPASEARRLIAKFDERYAVVRAFQDEQLRLAREQGFVTTLAGRRWPLQDLDSTDARTLGYAERLARRATHEASVADVGRRALLQADRALRGAGLSGFPLLQVLDEVLFEVPADELDATARLAAHAMQTAYDLRVPLRVGCKAGPSWADMEPLG